MMSDLCVWVTLNIWTGLPNFLQIDGRDSGILIFTSGVDMTKMRFSACLKTIHLI